MSWTPYESTQRSPARNLAWEDVLLESRERGRSVFLVYRNDPCVVVGRNQNPWREAATDSGFPVFRRRSGGGTVYHDPGNLNWSFMVERDAWVVDDALEFVSAALGRLGIRPTRDSRGALFLEGGKICGTARRYFGPSVLIHGTLLVSSDLPALRRSLSGIPSEGDRAVASVRSRVRNLEDVIPGLTVDSVRDALFAELESRYGAPKPEDPGRVLPEGAWSDREREHGSWEWVFGSTMPFCVALVPASGAAPGDEELFLRVREGRVESVRTRADIEGASDRSSDSRVRELPEAWAGKPFDTALLEEIRAWAAGRAAGTGNVDSPRPGSPGSVRDGGTGS